MQEKVNCRRCSRKFELSDICPNCEAKNKTTDHGTLFLGFIIGVFFTCFIIFMMAPNK